MESPDESSPPITTSGDTENSTHFHPDEGRESSLDPHRELPKWQRLSLLNEGMWNGPREENTEALRNQDNLHIYDAIACQLELTDYQKERGRSVYEELPLHKLGRPVEQYGFAVCILVANEDAEGSRYWPSKDKPDNDPLFREFGERLGLSFREQSSALMKVKSRSDL